MKAMTRSVYGSADVLEFIDVEAPVAAEDEVLLRVHAAGAGPEVWHVMTGLPYLVRIMGFGLRKPKNPILGMDVAGVVETVGTDVTQVRPGDAVFGTCVGSFAEYACARAGKLPSRRVLPSSRRQRCRRRGVRLFRPCATWVGSSRGNRC
jgi:NADPH:quinone reductase-like Zn-dependent oxidoreductase